jgi:Zn-dependent protease
VLIAGTHTVLVKTGTIELFGDVSGLMFYAVGTNFILFFFNLIPAPPLDGGHVAEGLMPYKHRAAWENIARFGPFLIILIVIVSPLAKIFTIPANFCAEKLYLLMGLL